MITMNFWEELRSLEEPTKTKILVVATVLVMVVVVYFWMAYFNNLIAGSQTGGNAVGVGVATAEPAQPSAPAAAAPAAAAEQSAASVPGFWQNAANGTAFLFAQFVNAMRGLGNIFAGPRQYLIKP